MLAYGGNLTELVRGAIMESGAPGTAFALDHTSSFPAKQFLTEDSKNLIMLQKTGCVGAVDEIACLRVATTTHILSGQSAIVRSRLPSLPLYVFCSLLTQSSNAP